MSPSVRTILRAGLSLALLSACALESGDAATPEDAEALDALDRAGAAPAAPVVSLTTATVTDHTTGTRTVLPGIAAGAHARGRSAALWWFDGATWHPRRGTFD